MTEQNLALRVRRDASNDRPPAVLLPATGKTAADWDQVIPAGRTVVAVDLRGHGDSFWPGSYELPRFADDVAGMLEDLDLGAVDLVGHSLGGLVACLVASSRPELIRRLVVEDIGILHPRTPSMPSRPAGELPFDWRMVEQVRAQIDSPDTAFWRSVAAGIGARTLIVAGGAASPVPQEQVAELAAVIPDARLVTIESGHLVHETRPVEFRRVVEAFLDDEG
ncbi:alpha/beta hydrolase [Actinoplanes sp. OR16]|uniref:alpha/beta fold hydrolase n=1 Tax=Actinoplanes sp. OR16 TaxID=946334 RepID=UPI000F712015|nr:alpha/beta hydrolase [Actinoplanes sp. OR16]BBH63370.1 alpha/beta hydrolase [Actinoplanes sp. OR16]